ncbi:MAG: 3-keto-disaccharide hydrolase, partial [Segetibacter sp.]
MKQKVVAIGVIIFSLVISSFTYMASKDNTLTPSEKKAGWKLLFDGKDLDGWRPYQNQTTNSWTVDNGIMYCKGSVADKSDKRADMITKEQYENFDLSVDWKISPQGNSGILYMVTEEFPRSY